MEVSFVLKKVISAFLLPIPWAIFCFILGVGLLWFTRQQTGGKIFTTLGLFILLISVVPYLPNYLLKNLESRYPPLTATSLPRVAYVIVLGGGQIFNKDLSANSQLEDYSLSRLIEGIRLYRAISGARLLLSGGAVSGWGDAEAVTMQKAAISLGVPPQDILLEATAKDTHEEAVNIRPMLGTSPFILVTSAFHMPRAMAIFANLQMHPIAAPTGYYGQPRGNGLQPSEVISPANAVYLNLAIHEYLGMWWEKFKAAQQLSS